MSTKFFNNTDSILYDDKAYVDFFALCRFHKVDAYWVSRPKDNMRYEVMNHRNDFDSNTGICGDFTVRLAIHRSNRSYPEPIRMVTCHDSETGHDVEFITNNFEVSALEVAHLNRHRWDIEVFFKWIKRNIVTKTLWGYTENAVRTHLWVAIIAYLIIDKIKADYKSPYTITEVATLIRIYALERVGLRDLITKLKDSIIQNQHVKEITLFDDF